MNDGTATNRGMRESDRPLPDGPRGVTLVDVTTGRATVFPHPLARSATGSAWSLLRAICRLNPNIMPATRPPEGAAGDAART